MHVEFLTPADRALLAIQGPEAVKALQQPTTLDLKILYFMRTSVAGIAGAKECRISRCGYTGEDGFEISIPAGSAAQIADALLNAKRCSIKLAGLGARDSLR